MMLNQIKDSTIISCLIKEYPCWTAIDLDDGGDVRGKDEEDVIRKFYQHVKNKILESMEVGVQPIESHRSLRERFSKKNIVDSVSFHLQYKELITSITIIFYKEAQ